MSYYTAMPVVAIIGGGFSGAAVALHLVENGRAGKPARVVVFEPRDILGAGLAYDTHEPAHRINVPAARMSLYPDDPGSFQRWIDDTHVLADDPEAIMAAEQVFPRRQAFGTYVHDTLAPHIADGRIEHRQATVVGLARSGATWRLSGSDGRDLVADIVVLAVSHPAPALPSQLKPLAGHPRLVADPTARDALDVIRADDRVLIVGNGLTSADVVAALTQRGHQGPILSVSRRGLRSRGHSAIAHEPAGDFLSPPSRTASQLLQCIRIELRAARRLGLGWQPVLDAVRAQGQQIWKALPVVERQRIARHIRPFWDAHRFRVAPQVEAVLDGAIEAGRLEILAASLSFSARTGDEIGIGLKLRRRNVFREVTVDAVVVTTGPSHGGILRSQPFLSALQNEGLLAACATGLGIACDDQSRALDASGNIVPALYIAGPLARGTFGELMGLPQVTEHAVFVAGQVGDALERSASTGRVKAGTAG